VRFAAGEWAVFKHQDGGRLFQVHEDADDEWVTERHPIPSQQQYIQPDHVSNLMKVKDRDDAVAAVAVLDFIQHQYQRDVSAAEELRGKRFHYVVGQYEFVPEEVPL
jgi:hypothetical protein